MDKKLVFCGGGNMAENITKGLLKSGVMEAGNIALSELRPERCEYLEKTYSVKAAADVSSEMKAADIILIAVNPFQVADVTKTVSENASEGAIIISIAAGITLASLSEQLGRDKKIVRVMPNTLSASGSGYSAACINANITENDKAVTDELLKGLGQVMFISEDMFDTFTAFSCSGPIWLYRTAQALIDAGVYSGFTREQARGIVLKNMLGVARILDESGAHPAVKIDEMCSPAGVTIEALRVIEEEGIAAGLIKSVDAAVKKANSIK